MTTENEEKLSTKNETKIEVENMKLALSKMTDTDIQNIFDRGFEDFQRSKLDPNHANED